MAINKGSATAVSLLASAAAPVVNTHSQRVNERVGGDRIAVAHANTQKVRKTSKMPDAHATGSTLRGAHRKSSAASAADGGGNVIDAARR